MQNKPYIDPLTRSILLNVLWHHQGGSAQVGQPIRAMLGIGEYARLTDWQVRVAQEIESMVRPQPGVAPPDWEKHVKDAWVTLRKFNQSIPDDVLDGMRAKLLATKTPWEIQAAENAIYAERYRALRDERNQILEDDPCVTDDSFYTYFGEELDKAVDRLIARNADAAIQAEPQKDTTQ